MAWLVFHVMWYIPGYSKMMHTKARLSMEAMVTDVEERNLLFVGLFGLWTGCQTVSDAYIYAQVPQTFSLSFL